MSIVLSSIYNSLVRTSVPLEATYVLNLIALSDFNFYLTGSRANPFTVDFPPEADFDFFTVDDSEVEKFLADCRFRREPEPRYPLIFRSLQDIVGVFKHPDVPVHIQLIHDVEKKLKIQNRLFGNIWFWNLDKLNRARVWEYSYSLTKF
jgi:hypothetical protein